MKRLTMLRQAKGWSRAELARQANLNQSTVGLIENGRLIPYASQLHKLAAALGVGTPSDLVAEVSEESSVAQ